MTLRWIPRRPEKKRLLGAIRNGERDASFDTIGIDDQCAFGKWLFGPTIDPTTRTGEAYRVI